jgi:hypothetical protein
MPLAVCDEWGGHDHPVVNRASCHQRRRGRGGGAVPARLRPGPCARGDGLDGAAHPVDRRRAHLGELHGHARLSAPRRARADSGRWLLGQQSCRRNYNLDLLISDKSVELILLALFSQPTPDIGVEHQTRAGHVSTPRNRVWLIRSLGRHPQMIGVTICAVELPHRPRVP